MSCFSEFSQFSAPITNQEDLDVVEMSRRKALERINALYNEILNPADTVTSDAEISSLSDREDNTESEKVQNHFLKSCCTTLRELCSKCQQRISQCKSCNYCSCSNTSSVKCREKPRDDSESSSRQSSSRRKSQSAVKCTKPCPFSFVAKDNERLRTKEEKLAKIKETLNQRIDTELKVRVVSKPVPKHVYLPLYKQMAEAKEKRKTVRKEKCSEVLNNAQVDDDRLLRERSESVTSATTSHDFMAKPTQEARKTSTKDKCFEVLNNAESSRVVDSYKFRERSKSSSDFSASKPQGHTTQTIPKNVHSNIMVEKLQSREHVNTNYAEISKSSSDLNALKSPGFKAKPAPKNILSNKISEKLKNKEQVRKMLMTERAQQLKEQSSLPFSQRNLPRASSMINLDNFAKPNKDYSKKNISEITKRLYVIKCNDALNAWNEKVLKVVTGKKFEDTASGRNEKRLERKSLPFLFFPVRMSNAALMREKEIRDRIAVKNALDKKRNELENSKMKINSEIAKRLKRLMPSSERDRKITEKVASYRDWQFNWQKEYDRELQEIMMRVAEQSLLLERIPKKDQNIQKEKTSIDRTMQEDEQESNKSSLLQSEAVYEKDFENSFQADGTDSESENFNETDAKSSSASEANLEQSNLEEEQS